MSEKILLWTGQFEPEFTVNGIKKDYEIKGATESSAGCNVLFVQECSQLLKIILMFLRIIIF